MNNKTIQEILKRECVVNELLDETLTREEFFWLRIDVGLVYLRNMHFPPDRREFLRNSRVFWLWFLQNWAVHERQVTAKAHERIIAGGTQYTIREYYDHHKFLSLKCWMNGSVEKLVTEEQKTAQKKDVLIDSI